MGQDTGSQRSSFGVQPILLRACLAYALALTAWPSDASAIVRAKGEHAAFLYLPDLGRALDAAASLRTVLGVVEAGQAYLEVPRLRALSSWLDHLEHATAGMDKVEVTAGLLRDGRAYVVARADDVFLQRLAEAGAVEEREGNLVLLVPGVPWLVRAQAGLISAVSTVSAVSAVSGASGGTVVFESASVPDPWLAWSKEFDGVLWRNDAGLLTPLVPGPGFGPALLELVAKTAVAWRTEGRRVFLRTAAVSTLFAAWEAHLPATAPALLWGESSLVSARATIPQALVEGAVKNLGPLRQQPQLERLLGALSPSDLEVGVVASVDGGVRGTLTLTDEHDANEVQEAALNLARSLFAVTPGLPSRVHSARGVEPVRLAFGNHQLLLEHGPAQAPMQPQTARTQGKSILRLRAIPGAEDWLFAHAPWSLATELGQDEALDAIWREWELPQLVAALRYLWLHVFAIDLDVGILEDTLLMDVALEIL